jgi:hypothetical protein
MHVICLVDLLASRETETKAILGNIIACNCFIFISVRSHVVIGETQKHRYACHKDVERCSYNDILYLSNLLGSNIKKKPFIYENKRDISFYL